MFAKPLSSQIHLSSEQNIAWEKSQRLQSHPGSSYFLKIAIQDMYLIKVMILLVGHPGSLFDLK